MCSRQEDKGLWRVDTDRGGCFFASSQMILTWGVWVGERERERERERAVRRKKEALNAVYVCLGYLFFACSWMTWSWLTCGACMVLYCCVLVTTHTWDCNGDSRDWPGWGVGRG